MVTDVLWHTEGPSRMARSPKRMCLSIELHVNKTAPFVGLLRSPRGGKEAAAAVSMSTDTDSLEIVSFSQF